MDWIPTAGTPREVTQKLETPVVYFYSDQEIDKVSLAVTFPHGIITEYYPAPALNLPPIGGIGATANGHAEWEIRVHDRETHLAVPPVDATSIWAPSRRVTANFVESLEGEKEHHVFYRGLGRWDGDVRVTSTLTDLMIYNLGNQTISAIWILVSDGVSRGFVKRLDSLHPMGKVEVPLSQNGKFDPHHFVDLDLYVTDASVQLEAELIKAGLYPLEARAMVDTWDTSYFRNFGTRILYITPKGHADSVLPWKVTPIPSEEERVLVGRIEIILRAEEMEFNKIATRLIKNSYTSGQLELKLEDERYLHRLGRFADSKVRSVLTNEIDKTLLENWIFRKQWYQRRVLFFFFFFFFLK
eukprot:TRINITY_DN192_c0_g1_i6.p1 TRINITY_DN192_c0_g1~~TRINITY_DN192_c0_g1_i6.p1  ORF type:complete len:356 (+),score=75.81 TRINITY_DN192_c0_g1_i6:380-1447(+)